MMTTLGKACDLKAGKFVSAKDIQDIFCDGFYPCYGGNGIRGYVNNYSHDGCYPLIGRQGALCGNVNYASGKFRATEHAVVVKPLIEIDTRWLYYKLISMNLGQYATGAAQPGLAVSTLEQLPINIPTLEAQKISAQTIDIVNNLISLRKQQLAKLDDLVKARFIELFGDQKTNPYNLEVGKLSDVADIYLGLTHTPTYVEHGKPFLSVRDISSGVVDFSNCHYITEEEFDSLPKGARPQAGDMLFCRVGTIGKPVIIPENIPEFGTFVSVGYLRKKANVNNYYLKAWMENEYFMRQVYDNVAGASQINLNTGWLKNFRILVPPMELQNQFAAFVEQTDKSKSAIQQSLDKLETLKGALMQKYFG